MDQRLRGHAFLPLLSPPADRTPHGLNEACYPSKRYGVVRAAFRLFVEWRTRAPRDARPA